MHYLGRFINRELAYIKQNTTKDWARSQKLKQEGHMFEFNVA